MNDINVILDIIKKDAEETMKRLDSQTSEEIEKMRKDWESETEEILKSIQSDAEIRCKRIIDGGKAKCVSAKKLAETSAKTEAINKIISAYITKIISLPDGEYFDLLSKAVDKYSDQTECRVILSEFDSKRDVSVFKEKIKSLETDKRKFVFSDKVTNSIKSGCIVSYGEIEENLSWESIVELNSDNIKDALICAIYGEKQ